MTGETAKDNLDGFDFTSTWKVVDGDYPILRFNVAPKDLSVSDSSVSQSDGVDAVVGTLTAEDPNGDTLSYSLINGNGDDDNGNFSIDGTELRADNASTMPAGDYSVRVEAADGKGGTTENALTVTVVDDLPPQLTVTVTDNTDGDGTLAAGDEVQIEADITDVTDVDTVTADASAFDAGHQVDLSHDTGTIYKESVTVGQNPSQGTQSVTVTATDTKDNEASVTDGQLTVDTNPPDITGVTISDDDGNDVLADGDDLTIEAEVTDATTVDTVTADVSAFDEGEISLSSTKGDTYSKTITLDGSLEDGAQSVTVSATDDLGNGGGQDSNSNELTVDTTPPSITSVTITDATDGNGILADGDDLTIEAEVTDANTVDTVTADAAAYDAGTVTLTHAGGGTYDTTLQIGANPTERAQSVTVSATDIAGNGGGQASASNALTVDLTPPATADDAGTGNEDENGTALVDDIRTNDDDGVSDSKNLTVTKVDENTNNVGEAVAGTDGGQFTVTANGKVTFDANADFEPLNDGDTNQTSVAVTVADEAGNENTSTVTATVEGVNDDPTNLSVDNATVRQSAGVNATVGTLSAEDVDNDVANLTYTLVAGTGDANNSAFRIDGDDLQARNASTMADGEYDVRVEVEDPDDGTTAEPFTVTVVDDVAPIVGPVTLTDATDGNGILAAGDDLTITATVTDVTAVDTVRADAAAFDNATVTLEETATDTYETTVTVGNDPAEFDQSVTVNATDTLDNGGDQATVSESIVVDTTPPTTRDDTGRASEDTTGTRLIADVRASNTDAVSAATDLVVTAVDGNESVVDAPVTGTNGGRFTVSADGRVLFDGNADFESLYTGETDRTSISVTVADEARNEATQTVTAVVDGVTDDTGGGGGSSASVGRATPSSSPAQTSTVSLQDVYGGQRIVVDFARQQVTTSVVPPADASAASGRAQASVPAGDVRNVQSDGLVLTVADRGDYDLTVTARDVDVFARNARSAATDAPTTADDAASDDSASDVASSDADLSTDALGEESRQFVEATARRPVGFITVDHSFEPDDLETATHRFRVRKSYLAATGATAEGVTLYRDGPDGYRDLPTREVDADETFHYFEAETPGFSTFVIGTDAPVFDLGDPALVTADETSGRVEATVPVENVGTHAGTYTARLRGDGTVLATTTVSVPPGETVTARVQTTLPDADGVTLSLAGRSLGTVSSGGQETVAEADEEPSDSSSPLVAVGIALLVFVVLAGVILGAWRRTEPTDESTDDADDASTDDADDESTDDADDESTDDADDASTGDADDESPDDVTVDPATETPPAAADEPAPDGPERATSEAVSDTPGGRSGRPDTERATDDQYSGEPDAGASDTTAPPGTTDATRSTATNDPSAESADTESEERPPSETDEPSEER